MNTILTDDEIEDAWCKYGDEMGGADQSDALRIGREIEAAVLAKLREQEPVAWMRKSNYGPFELHTGVGDPQETWPSNGHSWQPLYAAPQPAVVQVPVAWLVTGPYEKRAFTDLNFANACCRGLNKGFGEEAYTVTPLVPYAAPPIADWYCEAHPEHLMGHDGCTGGGIPECARVGQIANQLRLARQEIREIAQHRDDLVAQYRAALAAPLPAVVQVPQGVDVEGRRIAAEAENHACSLAVWMTRMDAESPDADDLGVSGWLQEAEERIKRRMLAAAPEAPAQEKSNG